MQDMLEAAISTALEGQPYFEKPLFGYADIFDPIFTEFKTVVGPHHLSAAEAFFYGFDEQPMHGSVVVWILPIITETIESNRQEDEFPSKSWAHTRHFGEIINNQIRKIATEFLSDQGQRAVAPLHLQQWKLSDDSCSSNWSERHAAFAAGLGSFGLSDAFITDVGVCHRIGSLVTDKVFPITKRFNDAPYHRCLYMVNGSCGVCRQRCPAQAISATGHDRHACHHYAYGIVNSCCNDKFGVDISGCGLCLTAIPCEKKSPL